MLFGWNIHHATHLAQKMNLFNYIPLNKSSTYSVFETNNQSITKDIIYNLIDFYDITMLLTLYQKKSTQIYSNIKESLVDPTLCIDIICDVLLANKTQLDNQKLLLHYIIMKYYTFLQKEYVFELKQLEAICDITELTLKKMFDLNDTILYKYSKNKRKYKLEDSLQKNLNTIVNNIPETILSPEVYIPSNLIHLHG